MTNTCPRCGSLCVKFKFLNQFGENDQNEPRFLCLECEHFELASISTPGALGQTSASNLLQESASRDDQTYTRHATEETAQPSIASTREQSSSALEQQVQERCLVPAPVSTSDPSPSDARELQPIPIPPESTMMRTTPGTEGTFTIRVVNNCPRCSLIHSAGINTWHQISTVDKPRYECQMCKSIFDLGRMFYQTGQAVFSEAVGDPTTLEEPIDIVMVKKTCPICSSTSTRFKSLIVYSAKSSRQLCLKCSRENRLQLQLASEKLSEGSIPL